MKHLFLQFAFALTIFLAQAQINDPYFEQVDYIGAFGTTDWTSDWVNWTPQSSSYAAHTDIVEGEITTNTTWVKSKVYLLKGFVYVTDGATLTIEAGTVIRGDKDSKGTLIIEKGGKIHAAGTANEPIIFTSNQDAGNRSYGDWGGLVICGKARINVTGGSATVEGGPRSTYGGNDDTDSSGMLKYVRIEFAGIPLLPDKEINGLTLGGVGNKTMIEYIQVSFSGDDAYEWFGGTVNAKHLVSFRNWDDDFDTDFGFTGKIQFAVALRDPNIADVSGSNGFESDNDGTGSTNEPITSPTFSNVSYFGPKITSSTSVNSNYKRAMHLRRNSRIDIYNSFFAGHPTGLFIDGTATQNNASSQELNVKYVILSGMTTFFASSFERTYFTVSSMHNDTFRFNTQLMITDPFNLDNPNFLPLSGSPVLDRSIWYTSEVKDDHRFSKSTDIHCYPNPSEGEVILSFKVSNPQMVHINLFDLSGKLILPLVNEFKNDGHYTMSLQGEDLPTGIYLLKGDINNTTIFTKVLIK